MTRTRPSKVMHSKRQDMKLFFTVRTHFNRQAGNWVSTIYLKAYRVERKPVLSSAEWCLLDFILILLGTNFFENGSPVFRIAAEFAFDRNILRSNGSFSYRRNGILDHEDWTNMPNGSNIYWTVYHCNS